MYYYEVAPTQIIRSGSDSFTYSHAELLATGSIVRVTVGKKQVNGVILSASQTAPSYAVKAIDTIIEKQPIPAAIIKLARWLSAYYATPLATVLQTVLPSGLHKNRRIKQTSQSFVERIRTNYVLNKDQQSAVETIVSSTPGTAVLHGVTGSGKTAVYIELAKRSISDRKSVIILVPEIALTSQLVAEFTHHFSNIILTHSKQTEAERHQAWQRALDSQQPHIVIGPRSALFMPVPALGLIVIDESHEPSYKQEQSPRYNALRAATYLAEQTGARLVLGSATPSVVDYFLAESNNRPIVPMNKRALTSAVEPTVKLVDMTKRATFKRHRFLSDDALEKIEQSIASNKQVLLFHNRRGSAPTTLCENCGWQAGCPHCFLPLTLHADSHQLRCHICNFTSVVPTSCPECHNASIIHKGIGTKLIEAEISRLFPKLSIARFDGDTDSAGTVEQRYRELYDGSINIIIGTQVIAKGLDLPHLGAVIVVQADAGLSLPDYSSPERTFQLLAQVIGRVGRADHPTNVIVQSYQPTHPAITLGLTQNYAEFYTLALQQRKRGNFPPYSYLLKLQCSYKTEAAAIKNSRELAKKLRNELPSSVEILGPTPSFYERAGGSYRWQLILQSPKRAHLLEALRHLPSNYWQFELDPISLL